MSSHLFSSPLLVQHVLVSGIIATLIADLWQVLLVQLKVLPSVSWAIPGRWVLGFAKGRLYAPDISRDPVIPGETAVGWMFHYVIGLAYALIFLLLLQHLNRLPTISTGLLFGAVTLVAPFLVMMPAMGRGLFGLRSPNPGRSIFISSTTHLVFGLGVVAGLSLSTHING